MSDGYDFTPEQRDTMRNDLIAAFREQHPTLEVVGTFDDTLHDDGNGVDVWFRTPNGYRIVASVSVWRPNPDDE